jgi:hypothetical protein
MMHQKRDKAYNAHTTELFVLTTGWEAGTTKLKFFFAFLFVVKRNHTSAAKHVVHRLHQAWLKLPSLSIDIVATSSASVAMLVLE